MFMLHLVEPGESDVLPVFLYLESSWLLPGLNAVPHVPAERSCRYTPTSTWGSPSFSLLGHRQKASLSSMCPTGTDVDDLGKIDWKSWTRTTQVHPHIRGRRQQLRGPEAPFITWKWTFHDGLSKFSNRCWCSIPPLWFCGLQSLWFRFILWLTIYNLAWWQYRAMREHNDTYRKPDAVLVDATQRVPAEYSNCCRPVNTSGKLVSPVCLRHKRHNWYQ